MTVALHELGNIRLELGRADCVPVFEEDLKLSERIGDWPGAAVTALNLGHAYLQLPACCDLAQATNWYERSLELRDERDRDGKSGCLVQLGTIARRSFQKAQESGRPMNEQLAYLNEAARRYHAALEIMPPDAVAHLAVINNQLGATYADAGDPNRALSRFQQAIQLLEAQDDLYGASRIRLNVAFVLRATGRREDALEYAIAALRGFESFGERDMIQKTQRLIAEIREGASNA